MTTYFSSESMETRDSGTFLKGARNELLTQNFTANENILQEQRKN